MSAPALSPNALRVLEARYLRRDTSCAVIETPEELFQRVARAIAQAELLLATEREADHWQAVFHDLLSPSTFCRTRPR
jgi:ribonucleoside-diphosphate reductase alpha chain